MEDKRLIHTIKLQNLLSYGSKSQEIELHALNVIIGANTSGKSNLIEAFNILKATPADLMTPIRKGGGISDFLWKGVNIPIALIEVVVPHQIFPIFNLKYRLCFTEIGQRTEVVEEIISKEHPGMSNEKDYYSYQNGQVAFNGETLSKSEISSNQSILSQRKDPNLYPQLTYLGNKFSQISLYRDWNFGQGCELRRSQKTDAIEHPLLEDCSNFGIFLNNLIAKIGSREIVEKLQKFYDEAEEIITKVYGGTVQVFIREKGFSQPIPANRLSDGTLRYLFLLAILLDPAPPPLICIEEPEIGLHPDMIATIAELLIEASQRTQLIITTHSEALISSLSPEMILVCDRDQQGTHLQRLDSERLKKWLENYSLGDLWSMGEIGGTRW